LSLPVSLIYSLFPAACSFYSCFQQEATQHCEALLSTDTFQQWEFLNVVGRSFFVTAMVVICFKCSLVFPVTFTLKERSHQIHNTRCLWCCQRQ